METEIVMIGKINILKLNNIFLLYYLVKYDNLILK